MLELPELTTNIQNKSRNLQMAARQLFFFWSKYLQFATRLQITFATYAHFRSLMASLHTCTSYPLQAFSSSISFPPVHIQKSRRKCVLDTQWPISLMVSEAFRKLNPCLALSWHVCAELCNSTEFTLDLVGIQIPLSCCHAAQCGCTRRHWTWRTKRAVCAHCITPSSQRMTSMVQNGRAVQSHH